MVLSPKRTFALLFILLSLCLLYGCGGEETGLSGRHGEQSAVLLNDHQNMAGADGKNGPPEIGHGEEGGRRAEEESLCGICAGSGETTAPAILGPRTERVSVSSGAPGNGHSTAAAISADGRYLAFESRSNNLVENDTNEAKDIFVRDLRSGEITRISVGRNGEEGDGPSASPAISADGRFVAFTSEAGNLVPGDTNGAADIFIHDRQTGQTDRISVASDGTEGNGASGRPAISADGRSIAFESEAGNLVPEDANGFPDIFVHDRRSKKTIRVSVTAGGEGNGASTRPSISGSGRYVAFQSEATNLAPGDADRWIDLFVYDRETDTLDPIHRERNGHNMGPAISADGRYVAFHSGSGADLWAVYVYDRETGTIKEVSVNGDGLPGNGDSFRPAISADGRYIAFESSASNLVADDLNHQGDIFIYDQEREAMERVSVASDGTEGNDVSRRPAISADGRFVAFDSCATTFAPGDTPFPDDVYLRDRGAR